ncbi:DUF4291 domain-containing protein [Kitasatospora indigofera]|uniref:DUF4291 domain-containing protein n=1 Tax=Kitasatospora indigofera TaxID=67307 RepID=UPI003651F6F1
MSLPVRQIRAVFTTSTITVYQAFPAAIGIPAARTGRFPTAFDRERMTWIKPSFHWMMYRSDWGRAPGQERVLALEITREGFEWALARAVESSYRPRLHPSRDAWRRELRRGEVRVQWDPERDAALRPLPWRALQVGLRGEAVRRYADEWLVSVSDVTALAGEVRRGGGRGAPVELPYPLPEPVAAAIGATG